MSENGREDNERLHDLLIERSLRPLGVEEQALLESLRRGQPEVDAGRYERLTAAVDLAYTPMHVHLPPELEDKVMSAAQDFFSAVPSEAGVPPVAPPITAARPAVPPARRRGGSWSGWLAAAACLVLALWGWWPQLRQPAPGAVAPLSEQSLMASDPQTLRLSWTATEDPLAGGATGQVVWSPAAQTGLMTFLGLPANDPAQAQYQLWIFDAGRGEGPPVDGGVFDIAPGSVPAVVSIDPKLEIERPTAFAVTIERPGGVVVSKQEHVLLLAKPTGQ